jgi:hypothetical protein
MSASELIWVASFDIGKKNFAFYIEECNKKELGNVECLPYSERYHLDGTPTETFTQIINQVCINGKMILFENVDLTTGTNKDYYLDTAIFHNMTDVLNKYTMYWDKCDTFLIEKQMSFGKKHNTMALKLGQHCWSYFELHYRRTKEIIEFPAYHKTQVLGAKKIEIKTKTGKIKYKAVEKTDRKKWSVEKAMDILKQRNDNHTISKLTSVKKRDDLADVLCQLQAFKILVYLGDNTS